MSFVQLSSTTFSFSYPSSVRALFAEETQCILEWMHERLPNSHLNSHIGELVFYAQQVELDTLPPNTPDPERFFLQASFHVHEQLHYSRLRGWNWASLNKESALVAHLFFANGTARSFLCDPTLLFPLRAHIAHIAQKDDAEKKLLISRPLPTPVWETPELIAVEELPCMIPVASFFYAWASYIQSVCGWDLTVPANVTEYKKKNPKLYWFLHHALEPSLKKRCWLLV